MRKYAGHIVFYVLFALVPLALWIAGDGAQVVLDDYFGFFSTIAKAAGLVGICVFSGNLVLSGRYKFLDALFGGLDKVYLFHRGTGLDVFSLVLVHVLAVGFRAFEISFGAAMQVWLTDVSDWSLNFGRLAFEMFLGLIVVTLIFSRKIRYERLKFLHAFMGVALLFGAIHAYLIPSDVAFNQPLRWYVLSVVGVSLASYFARTVFKRRLVRRIACDVTEVNLLSGGVTEVVMQPRGWEKVKFYPGQFIFVRFRQEGFPDEDHPFSLTASTEEGRLRISAKALGDYTAELKDLKPGAEALVQGPFGGFSFLFAPSREQVWIAGGIGVTPFASMARTIRDKESRGEGMGGYDIAFFHSGKSDEDLVFRQEFDELARSNGRFRFIPWKSEEKGFLTANKVKEAVGDLEDRDVFICGPKPMMEALIGQFRALGIPRSRIHFEEFKLL